MFTNLKSDREATVRSLYQDYRDPFLLFGRRFGVIEEDLLDAFQEGIIAFYDYCMKGKYDPKKSSPKTLIFSMAKYALLSSQRKKGKLIALEIDQLDSLTRKDVDDQLNDSLSAKQLQLRAGLAKLKEQCQKIIELFYLREYSIEAIVEEMGYQNENVVRSHKSRCLKRLRAYVTDMDQEG